MYFTLMDVKSGYWMVCLHKESSLFGIFTTPWGKYMWLWLPFILSFSSDVFQARLDAVNKTMPGVTDIADDVLTKGDDDISHDVIVLSLFEMALSNNLKLSPDKILFKMKE